MSQPPGSILEWQRWPLAEDGPKGWLKAGAVLLLVVIIGAVLLVSLPPTVALGLGVLVGLALLPYFLPRRYLVSEHGVVMNRGFWNDRREWADFRGYSRASDGYWLLPESSTPRPLGLIRAGRVREFYLARPLDPSTALALETALTAHLMIKE